MSAPREARLETLVEKAESAIAKNRARARTLVARIQRAKTLATPAVAKALAELRAPALYRALGHPSFASLLRAHALPSPPTARKLTSSASPSEPLAPKGRGAGVRGGPPTSRADRTALARLERRLRTRLRQGERTAWDVGTLFDRIARASLHHAAGFDTLERYADSRFPEHGYRTLARYRRIALAFTRATTIRHGALKLELALRYIELTPAHERPAEIPRIRIAVPSVGPVPFAKVTTRQLEQAIAAIAADQARPARASRLPRGAAPTLRALQARMKEGAPWPVATPKLSTRVTKDEQARAQALVTIHDVPVTQLPRLARALTRATGSPASAGNQ